MKTYLGKHPSGANANAGGAIQSELVPLLFLRCDKLSDCRTLVKMVLENREYCRECFSTESFLKKISVCFRKLGMIHEEIALLTDLTDYKKSGPLAAFIHLQLLEDALQLKDYALAEGAARIFLEKFPAHPETAHVSERLGYICYRKNDMRGVLSTLSRLSKHYRAEYPESLYYLGKAEEKMGNAKGAENAMRVFVERTERDGSPSPFEFDAYTVLAGARLSRGDRKGAFAAYRQAYLRSDGNLRDPILYKMGEVAKLDGRLVEARVLLEKLIKDGTDPEWKVMATRQLNDISWREKFGNK
jgi:tetratricopeptide (TPR) repeat protein